MAGRREPARSGLTNFDSHGRQERLRDLRRGEGLGARRCDGVGRNCGAPEGIRTPNLLIRSQVLYPLSYGRVLVFSCTSVWLHWRRREDLNLRFRFSGTTH